MVGVRLIRKPVWLDWRHNDYSSMIANMDTDDTPLPAHKPAFLRRVQIRGYKSIAFCDVTLEPLTVLVGRNASGKSNFLDALEFLRDVVNYGLSEAVTRHGGASSILCKSSNTQTLSIEVDCLFEHTTSKSDKGMVLSLSEWTATYKIVVSFENHAAPKLFSEECICEDTNGVESTEHFKEVLGFRKVPKVNGTMTRSLLDRTFLSSCSAGPLSRFARVLEVVHFYSFDPNPIRVPQKPILYQTLNMYGSNLASVVESTRIEDPISYARIARYLQAVVPDVRLQGVPAIGDYSILMFLVAREDGKPELQFDASSMSDGTLRTLAALTSVFQNVHEDNELTLVAIEEPETALHPAAMRALVSAFDAATMRTQVLLTTHSPDLLDAVEIKPENVRIVQMIDGQTWIGPIDEASAEIVRGNLDTLGGLERNDSLRIDHDDHQRQKALAGSMSEGQS
jgi:predicted ATPase